MTTRGMRCLWRRAIWMYSLCCWRVLCVWGDAVGMTWHDTLCCAVLWDDLLPGGVARTDGTWWPLVVILSLFCVMSSGVAAFWIDSLYYSCTAWCTLAGCAVVPLPPFSPTHHHHQSFCVCTDSTPAPAWHVGTAKLVCRSNQATASIIVL